MNRAIVIALATLTLAGCGDATPKATVPKVSGVTACHHAVESRLKAPSTAKFEPESEARTTDKQVDATDGSVTYIIEGWVDSQNGFGAQIRSDWMCAVVKSGGEWITDGSLIKINGE